MGEFTPASLSIERLESAVEDLEARLKSLEKWQQHADMHGFGGTMDRMMGRLDDRFATRLAALEQKAPPAEKPEAPMVAIPRPLFADTMYFIGTATGYASAGQMIEAQKLHDRLLAEVDLDPVPQPDTATISRAMIDEATRELRLAITGTMYLDNTTINRLERAIGLINGTGAA